VRALGLLLLSASLVAGTARAEEWHDCISTQRPAYVLEATADGIPVQLDRRLRDGYLSRAERLGFTGPVELSCVAVADRPRNCVALGASPDRYDFRAATLGLMVGARLTAPVGVWPIDVDVWLRLTDRGDPTPFPCGHPPGRRRPQA
jgi:hypothetical protein